MGLTGILKFEAPKLTIYFSPKFFAALHSIYYFSPLHASCKLDLKLKLHQNSFSNALLTSKTFDL